MIRSVIAVAALVACSGAWAVSDFDYGMKRTVDAETGLITITHELGSFALCKIFFLGRATGSQLEFIAEQTVARGEEWRYQANADDLSDVFIRSPCSRGKSITTSFSGRYKDRLVLRNESDVPYTCRIKIPRKETIDTTIAPEMARSTSLAPAYTAHSGGYRFSCSPGDEYRGDLEK